MYCKDHRYINHIRMYQPTGSPTIVLSLREGELPVMAHHKAWEAYCTVVEVHSPATVGGGDSLVEGGSLIRHRTAGLDLNYHSSLHHIHGRSLVLVVLFERKE